MKTKLHILIFLFFVVTTNAQLLKPGMAIITYGVAAALSDSIPIKIIDVRNHATATPGVNWNTSFITPPIGIRDQWKINHLGDVFSIAIDDVGDFYACELHKNTCISVCWV